MIRNQSAEIGEVVIGNNIWIGADAKMLNRYHIGDGAVIGADIVVSGDIPHNAIVASFSGPCN